MIKEKERDTNEKEMRVNGGKNKVERRKRRKELQ
jgi:hypothetical protein